MPNEEDDVQSQYATMRIQRKAGMDKMLNAETNPNARENQKTDYKTEIAKMLAQMRVIDEHIKKTQAETAQLRAETWVMLDHMKAELNVA